MGVPEFQPLPGAAVAAAPRNFRTLPALSVAGAHHPSHTGAWGGGHRPALRTEGRVNMNTRRTSSERGAVGTAARRAAGTLACCLVASSGALAGEKVPTFEDARIFTGVGVRPYGVAAANFDADPDGYPDVVVAVRGVSFQGDPFGYIVLFMNLGVDETTGEWLGFGTPPDVYPLNPLLPTEAYAVAVGNIDPANDPLGRPDIVVSASASDQVYVFRNDPFNPGSFLAPNSFDLPDFFIPRGIAVGYFGDSTSFLDIGVASGNTDKVIFLRNVNGTGTGFVIPPSGEVTLGTGQPSRGVVGGDFDATGMGNEDAVTPDFASVSPCQQPFANDTISALRNEGNYDFDVTQHTGGCGDFPWAYFAIAKGRFQGTGDNDLVASEQCRAYLDVILGDGVGGFTQSCSADRYQVHPNSSAFVDGVTTGHLNGGMKTDIVAAVTSTNEVALLLGRGDGTFQRPTSDSGYLYSVQDPTQLDMAMSPRQVIIVDLDQDGFNDIVTSCEGDPMFNYRHPALSVLINKMVVSIPP